MHLRAALLDMYNGETNRGIPMLRSILGSYADDLRFDHFDVRAKNELPDLGYDIYVFSGGPGDPLLNDGPWFEPFFELIESLWQWNLQADEQKKHCFFICHSFQMACHHFGIGTVRKRERMSFGTYPVHKTHEGKAELFFEGLADPFYIADFRRFQVLRPHLDRLKKLKMSVLCLETLAPHVHHERALMGVRFSPWMIGTQFHPEADPDGMLTYFMQEERKKAVVDEHGETRYHRMIHDLKHPEKIGRTFRTVIPKFLDHAIEQLKMELVAA